MWVLHRVRSSGGQWRLRSVLITWTALHVWLELASNPLIRLLGNEYADLQELELLQPLDLNEDYAVFAAAAAVLLLPSSLWWRYASAQHAATGLGTWQRPVKLARSVTRGCCS